MKRIIIKNVSVTAFLLLATYLFASFINADLNPVNWGTDARAIAAMCFITAWWVGTAFANSKEST